VVPLCSVFGFYGNTEQVCHFEDGDKIRLLAITNVGVGDAETHTQLFGKPRLGDASLLQMFLNEVDMFFLLSH